MFEYFQLIVFQLVERIAFIKKSLKQALMYGTDMLGFAYPALCTRHEVHGKPYLQEAKIKKRIVAQPEQTHKTITLRIWRNSPVIGLTILHGGG